MITSELQKAYNLNNPKGGYSYYTLYRGESTDTKPAYAQTGDVFEEYGTGKVYTCVRTNGKSVWTEDPNAKRQTETGGGGSSLPSMTGKNGKVLGVTLDAQDHEQAEWVTPSGGGGAEKFIVTLTEDDGTWTADKTIAAIAEAKEAGQIVVANATIGGMNFEIPLILCEAVASGTSVVVFAASNTVNQNQIPEIICFYGAEEGSTTEWGNGTAQINGVPSYSSSNNGQVLGVSSGSLTWVDNYAPLIVTLTEDQQNPGTLVGDKTFGEVYTAVSSGKTVYIYATGGYFILNACSLENGTYTIVGAVEGMTFTGTENDYPTVTSN